MNGIYHNEGDGNIVNKSLSVVIQPMIDAKGSPGANKITTVTSILS